MPRCRQQRGSRSSASQVAPESHPFRFPVSSVQRIRPGPPTPFPTSFLVGGPVGGPSGGPGRLAGGTPRNERLSRGRPVVRSRPRVGRGRESRRNDRTSGQATDGRHRQPPRLQGRDEPEPDVGDPGGNQRLLEEPGGNAAAGGDRQGPTVTRRRPSRQELHSPGEDRGTVTAHEGVIPAGPSDAAPCGWGGTRHVSPRTRRGERERGSRRRQLPDLGEAVPIHQPRAGRRAGGAAAGKG